MNAIEHDITLEQYARTLARTAQSPETEPVWVVRSRLDIDLTSWEVVSGAWKAPLPQENQSDRNDNLIAFASYHRDELTDPTSAVTPAVERRAHSGDLATCQNDAATTQPAHPLSVQVEPFGGDPHETTAIDPAVAAALRVEAPHDRESRRRRYCSLSGTPTRLN